MKERYLRSVRKLLDCPGEMQEQLMHRINSAITTYLGDYPDTDYTALIQTFGTPERCAADLLAEHYAATVAVQQKKRRHMRYAVTILTVVLVLSLCVVGYLWSHGGLVIIEHTHYDGIPEGFPMGGEGTITYHFTD